MTSEVSTSGVQYFAPRNCVGSITLTSGKIQGWNNAIVDKVELFVARKLTSGRWTSGSCGGWDWMALRHAACDDPFILFDLQEERVICKMEFSNGHQVVGAAAHDASVGARTIVAESGFTIGGPWTVLQTFSPLKPACPSDPQVVDLIFDDPPATQFLRLRVTESWGAGSVGIAEVLLWTSPWTSKLPQVNIAGLIPSPGLPEWATTGGRVSFAIATVGGTRSVLIMGGADSFGELHHDVHRTLDGGATWEVLHKFAPWTARRGHAAATTALCCHVVMTGGVSRGVAEGEVANSDVWLSDDGGLHWKLQISIARWRPRVEHSSVFDALDRLFVVGGLQCSYMTGPYIHIICTYLYVCIHI